MGSAFCVFRKVARFQRLLWLLFGCIADYIEC